MTARMFLRNYGWIGAAVAILVAALWLAAAAVVWAEGAGTKLLVLLSAAGMAICGPGLSRRAQ